jgi:propanol-preferring alcohol dehydrogenase
VVEDVTELAPYGLDLIVDFAGFGTTTAGAIEAVRPGGRVVQVGLGLTEATISTMALIARNVTLRGSGGGRPADTAAVLGHMARGNLTIESTTIGFDDIPEGLARLERGGVIGRIVAELDG